MAAEAARRKFASLLSQARRAVRTTRILLHQVPRLLADIIATLLTTYEDIEVVDDSGESDPVEAVARTSADVVVLGLDKPVVPEDVMPLFRHPRARVLGVVADGRRVFLYELRPERSELGEVSAQELVDIIRRVALAV